MLARPALRVRAGLCVCLACAVLCAGAEAHQMCSITTKPMKLKLSTSTAVGPIRSPAESSVTSCRKLLLPPTPAVRPEPPDAGAARRRAAEAPVRAPPGDRGAPPFACCARLDCAQKESGSGI